MQQPLRVLYLSSEVNPIAKVGGLGDVAGSLPRGVKKLGVDIRIAMPKYDVINTRKYKTKKIASNIPVKLCTKTETVNLFQTTLPSSRVPIYLIDNKKNLGNGGIYLAKTAFVDSYNEIKRFLLFSAAALEICNAVNWWPDVIHCQDWHTGLIPILLKDKSTTDPRYKKIRTLFTVHNLANQGDWKTKDILNFICPDNSDLFYRQKSKINFIASGITQSTAVNTVSRTYAKEITTPRFGEGLQSMLRKKHHLYGIVNGVDQVDFNPATDPNIIKKYTARSYKNAKAANKADLQKTMRLPIKADVPMVGLVSRLTSQKGIELITAAIPELVKTSAQIVMLGEGSPKLIKKLRTIKKKYPKQVAVRIEYNAALAKQIYAGSDIFLMPSRFEPCGLGQMIAMRYGTLPVVRSTGGLKDTVTPYNFKKRPNTNQATGFAFNNYSMPLFRSTTLRAIELFKANPKIWNTLIANAMAYNSTWDKAAEQYVKIYKKISSRKLK